MHHNNGVVYSMSNQSSGNQVIAFARRCDGTLTRENTYDTGGMGTGAQVVDPLASQGSLVLSNDGCFLFAVNAGSDSISSFAVSENGSLSLLSVVDSCGAVPNAIAISGNLLYVANKGNDETPSNIVGFEIRWDGQLVHIPNAIYRLSKADAKPACLVFHPNGKSLVVSELSTNQLLVFPVCCDGTLAKGTINPSNGAGPFGSIFLKNGLLIVTEAGVGAVSSYVEENRSRLHVKSKSVENNQKATCWISNDCNQQFAYTSNAGSNTISIYDIYRNGTLSLRKNVLSNPNANAAPLDSGVSCDGRYFYVLNGNEGSISVFQITMDGDLKFLQVVYDTGLPSVGAQGIAVL